MITNLVVAGIVGAICALLIFMIGFLWGHVDGMNEARRIEADATQIRVEDLAELGKGRVVRTYKNPFSDGEVPPKGYDTIYWTHKRRED